MRSAGGNVKIDQSAKVVDFGSGNVIGNVTFGDLGGENITKTNFTSTMTTTARVDDMHAVLKTIKSIREDLAKLELPEDAWDDRVDTLGELEKAEEAGRDGKKPRVLEKLESAQKLLLKIGCVSAQALELAEPIGALIQRSLAIG
jgi:hypothetical protein